jgi:hypothetical protein
MLIHSSSLLHLRLIIDFHENIVNLSDIDIVDCD